MKQVPDSPAFVGRTYDHAAQALSRLHAPAHAEESAVAKLFLSEPNRSVSNSLVIFSAVSPSIGPEMQSLSATRFGTVFFRKHCRVDFFHVQALHIGSPPHELWQAKAEFAGKLFKSPPRRSFPSTPTSGD